MRKLRQRENEGGWMIMAVLILLTVTLTLATTISSGILSLKKASSVKHMKIVGLASAEAGVQEAISILNDGMMPKILEDKHFVDFDGLEGGYAAKVNRISGGYEIISRTSVNKVLSGKSINVTINATIKRTSSGLKISDWKVNYK